MRQIKDTLLQMENRLQSWIEGNLTRLITGTASTPGLAHKFIAAIQDELTPDQVTGYTAPHRFILKAAPDVAALYRNNALLVDELSYQIEQAGSEAGIAFSVPPSIQIVADPDTPTGELVISLDRTNETGGSTAVLPATPGLRRPNIPASAYLIVDGQQVFPLNQPVINIGRRSDNHIIIEDLRVSRTHAQIRASQGHFTLFDLDSRGGTLINGQPVQQAILKPGDVISLAGVPIVFGCDIPDPDLGKTQEYRPEMDKPDL
jgi:hypothetical protein